MQCSTPPKDVDTPGEYNDKQKSRSRTEKPENTVDCEDDLIVVGHYHNGQGSEYTNKYSENKKEGDLRCTTNDTWKPGVPSDRIKWWRFLRGDSGYSLRHGGKIVSSVTE